MDIGGISGAYKDIYTAASEQSASRLENELDADYSKATDDELMDACKKFEAYFVEQMFKKMMDTVPKTESQSGANNTLKEYYQEQMVQQLAEDSTEQEGLGLAQMLYEQMKRNYGVE